MQMIEPLKYDSSRVSPAMPGIACNDSNLVVHPRGPRPLSPSSLAVQCSECDPAHGAPPGHLVTSLEAGGVADQGRLLLNSTACCPHTACISDDDNRRV